MYLYISRSMYLYLFTYMYISAAVSNGKRKHRPIFLIPFTICSSCKRKFVVFPFVYAETNASYLFANELNGQNRLSPHLCSWDSPFNHCHSCWHRPMELRYLNYK